MKTPKRIDMSLFEQPLIDLINASAKIFPASYSFVVGNANPSNYEYVKVTEVGPHKNEIYTWDIDKWVLVGADDVNIVWEEIKNKPTSFNPTTHSHTKSEITDFAHNHDTLYAALTHNHDASYSPISHNHDAQYSALSHNHNSTYAPISHDHDGRYNTKSEVSTLLGGKSDTSHTHASLHTHTNKTTIDKLTQTHIDALDNGLSSGHTHGNLPLLDKITYTGTQPTIDLIKLEESTGFSGDYLDLTNKPVIPSTTSELTNDSGFVTDVSGKADTTYVNTELAKKADGTTLSGHTGNSTIHVTQTDKDGWNTSKTTLDTHVINTLAHVTYALNTSANDSYTVAIPNVTEYVAGLVITFKATVANTGSCTLNVNGLGAKPLYRYLGVLSNLETGDILTNQSVEVVYDGANFIILSTPANVITTIGTQTLANKTLTAPKFADGGFIADASGAEQIKFAQTTSAVNEFTVKNAITGTAPELQASGNDVNIDINLIPKGTGVVNVKGKKVALQEDVEIIVSNIQPTTNLWYKVVG